MVVAHERAGEEPPNAPDSAPTRADALRRIAAKVSGRLDLDGLFRDVIDESFALFGVDQAGLWTYDESPTPLRLVAQRGLSPEILEDHRNASARRPDAGPRRAARARCPGAQGQLRNDAAGDPGDLSTGRDPDDLLRPDHLP